MSADFDLRPGSGGSVPPRPAQPPRVGPQQGGRTGGEKTPRSALGVSDPGITYPSKERARREQRVKTVHKTRNGGGFNPSVNPSISINVNKGGAGNGAGQGPGPAVNGGTSTPGSSFMSNEDIHKFSEHIRKEARKRAGERAMDAEQLEQVLRHIPDSAGSMAGARLRARRVSRHLKRIAKAEQLIAKEATAAYSSFEKEYEAELRKVGRGRTQQQPRTAFGWR